MNRRKKKPLALRLKHLAQAVASVSGASPVQRLPHVEVESLIEFYVDSEKRGEKVRTLYPAVWEHLKSCNRCRASYTLLTEATSNSSELEGDGLPSTRSVHPLPFLTAEVKDAAWSKHVRSRIGGAPLGFGFTIHSGHLQRLASLPAPALVLRDQSRPGARALLLSDTFTLGKREVLVELWSQRTEDPTQVQIEIALTSSNSLPDPLCVTVRWNEHHYSSQIHQGRGVIDRIAISDLESARDLRVDFEEISPGAMPEE